MDIKKILEKADALFIEERQKEAVAYLEEQSDIAKEQGEWQAELTMINELMGYYRSISVYEKAWSFANRAIEITEEHHIADTIEGVTTYLNVANIYRACGDTQKAMSLYKKVEDIYLKEGTEKDYKVGALYNNMTVASLELGKDDDAMKYSESALDVFKNIEEAWDECATTYSNLVGALLRKQNPDIEKANEYMDLALKLFEQNGGSPHYCSALAMKAYIVYLKKDLKGALEIYEKAMKETLRYYGNNVDYKRLENNYNHVKALLEKQK